MDNVTPAAKNNQPRKQLYGLDYGQWRDMARLFFPGRRAHQEIYLVLVSFAKRSPIAQISAPTSTILRRCRCDERTYRRVLGDLFLCGLVYPHSMTWLMRTARERGCSDPQLVVMDPRHPEVTQCAFLAFQWFLGLESWCRLFNRVMGEATAITKPTPPRGRMGEEELIQVVIRLITLRNCKSMTPCHDDHDTVSCSTMTPSAVTNGKNSKLRDSGFSLPLSTPKSNTKRVHRQADVVSDKPSSKEETPTGPPTLEEVERYAKSRGSSVDVEHFFAICESIGWLHGNRCLNWRQSFRAWERYQHQSDSTPTPVQQVGVCARA